MVLIGVLVHRRGRHGILPFTDGCLKQKTLLKTRALHHSLLEVRRYDSLVAKGIRPHILRAPELLPEGFCDEKPSSRKGKDQQRLKLLVKDSEGPNLKIYNFGDQSVNF